jgi:hypothetical protein
MPGVGVSWSAILYEQGHFNEAVDGAAANEPAPTYGAHSTICCVLNLAADGRMHLFLRPSETALTLSYEAAYSCSTTSRGCAGNRPEN